MRWSSSSVIALVRLLQGDEVEDVVVLVELALDLDGGAVVVAVQPLALVALVADEVAGAEDEVVLGDADLEAFSHGSHPRTRGCGERQRYDTLAQGGEQASGHEVGGRAGVARPQLALFFFFFFFFEAHRRIA